MLKEHRTDWCKAKSAQRDSDSEKTNLIPNIMPAKEVVLDSVHAVEGQA